MSSDDATRGGATPSDPSGPPGRPSDAQAGGQSGGQSSGQARQQEKGGAPAEQTSTSTSSPAPSSSRRATTQDPLRGSRASGVWVAVAALVVLLTLLSVFVLQNTQTAQVTFLGWTVAAPQAAILLIAVAAGLLIAVMAGTLRILQLRHRVRREQKRARS